jgi:uncharacterized membrane protein YqhA
MEEDTSMLRRILSGSRYLVIIAVLATFLASVSTLIYGGITVLSIIYEMFASGHFTTDEAKHIALEFIEMIDLFLLGTVLYIIALGLYELFIDEKLSMPSWLVITSLDDLKGKLIGVVIVLLAVTFLGEVVSWDGGITILALGLSIGLVLAALGYILTRSSQAHSPEETTTNNHQGKKSED